MQGEFFFALEGSQILTPGRLAAFLTERGIPVHTEIENGNSRLVFDEAGGTYANLNLNSEGEATSAMIYIKLLRGIDDFHRLTVAFQILGWTYCDSSYYGPDHYTISEVGAPNKTLL